MNADIHNCTRCGQELKDLRVHLQLDMYVERYKETGLWEEIPNLNQAPRDVLCKDCFDQFARILEQMNVPYTEEEAKRMEAQRKNPLQGLHPQAENSCSCETPAQLTPEEIQALIQIQEDSLYLGEQGGN